MKTILTLIIILFLKGNIQSQITKNNWLVGGSGSFKKTSSPSAGYEKLNYWEFLINANVGYFFADKLATGLRPNITIYRSKKYEIDNTVTIGKTIEYGLAPFLRYYILKPELPFNIFTEVSLKFAESKAKINGTTSSGTGDKSNTLGMYLGAVAFFNSSVGIEFGGGYYITNYNSNIQQNDFKVNIGFQIHLQKEK